MTRMPNDRLRSLMGAAGCNKSQLARAVRQVASEHGKSMRCDHTSVSRWLAGGRPRHPAAAYLLEALSRKLGRPVSAQEAGFGPGADILGQGDGDPLRRLMELTGMELDPARGHLLNSSVFSLARLSVEDTPCGTRLPLEARPGVARCTHAEVAQLRDMTTLFAQASQQHGGRPVRAPLAAYLAHTALPWLHAPAHEVVHQRMLSAVAQLALLLAGMCVDSAADGPAQRYQRIAARLAAEAGDHATLAIALRSMSSHAYDLGHHTTAVLHLAERAVEHARQASPLIQSYALAHLAVVQGHHARGAALTTLRRAQRVHVQGVDADTGPFTSYPVGALLYQRAQTLGALGDAAGSIRALNSSLRARTPTEHRARVLTRARLAETFLRQGHLEQAVHHWQGFLTACPTLRSSHVSLRLNLMRRHLRPHSRHPAAASLLAQAAHLA